MPHDIPRTTIRAIAERVGVSTTTVSLVLRHHPKISAATRERVERVAKELGYRPDPELAKLMDRLRRARQPHFKSTIAALTNIPEQEERPYHRELIAGSRDRADELGYRLEIFRFAQGKSRDSALQRILRSRGVDGVLLLPLHAEPLTRLLDWRKFSVVAATNGVLAPNFHRVVPHHFANTLLLCQNLARLGYRRLGLVVNREFDILITPGFSAAVVWQHVVGLMEPVAPLIHQGQEATEVCAWFERQRPDAIIARGFPDAEAIVRNLGLSFPGRIGLAISNLEDSRTFAGIDGHAGKIGAAAIDLLNSKIVIGERGVPATPMTGMIEGSWVHGPSVRRKKSAAIGSVDGS